MGRSTALACADESGGMLCTMLGCAHPPEGHEELNMCSACVPMCVHHVCTLGTPGFAILIATPNKTCLKHTVCALFAPWPKPLAGAALARASPGTSHSTQHSAALTAELCARSQIHPSPVTALTSLPVPQCCATQTGGNTYIQKPTAATMGSKAPLRDAIGERFQPTLRPSLALKSTAPTTPPSRGTARPHCLLTNPMPPWSKWRTSLDATIHRFGMPHTA